MIDKEQKLKLKRAQRTLLYIADLFDLDNDDGLKWDALDSQDKESWVLIDQLLKEEIRRCS